MVNKRYWLMKSEPDTFSIDDLKKCPKQTDSWEGVRNYQARNFMRDDMQVGDLAFFYHSNCKIPGIVGIMQIHQAAKADLTAQDPNSKYYDPKSTLTNPRWYMVTVKFIEKFQSIIPLTLLKQQKNLTGLSLLQPGNRLSIMPVANQQWQAILKLQKQLQNI